MTIRDWILQRTGEAGGEVEGVEFAYSPSSGRSGVGEPVAAPSRVSPGGAEWFSGKTGGGLGLLPLLPFLGGGTPEGMEAYNEAYGEARAIEDVSLQNAIEGEIAEKQTAENELEQQERRQEAQRKTLEVNDFYIKPEQSEQLQESKYLDAESYRKPAAEEQIQEGRILDAESYRKTVSGEQLQRAEYLDISKEYPEAQQIETIDVKKEYPEAQRMETLDVTKKYPEAQRMETLDVTKEYPEAQRMEDINQEAAFRSSGAGRSFGEPLSKEEYYLERQKRMAADTSQNLFTRALSKGRSDVMENPVLRAGEAAALIGVPAIIGGSALLSAGTAATASIPTAVQFGAEKAANTASAPAADYANYMQTLQRGISGGASYLASQAGNLVNQAATIINPYVQRINVSKVTAAGAGIGSVLSSLSSAGAESSAISSPGTSGNWDIVEQKITGTAKPISTGTVSKSTGITTKISKVK